MSNITEGNIKKDLTEEEKRKKIKELENKLRDRELKMTPQRRATLSVFLENPSKHMSTEEIYSLVKEKFPDIGLATVYRTLQLFDENDIIKKLNFGDGCFRYELSQEEDKHSHHHLLCLKCGRVFEFDEDLLDNLEKEIEKRNDFEIVDHMVKFVGYCSECKSKDK